MIRSCLAAVMVLSTAAHAQEILRLQRTIPMPVKGRIDHMAMDAQGQRLFVAALGNNSVEVIDLNAGKVIASLKDIDEVQGVAFLPESRWLCASSGGTGKLYIYDSSFQKIRTRPDLDDADNVRFDPKTNSVYVGYGQGVIAAIDPVNYVAGTPSHTPATLADIDVGAHPESFQLDPAGPRIFVNVPAKQQVAIIDRENRQVVARWPIENAAANFPMALDPADKIVFIACRKPAKLIAIDMDAGKMISSADTVGDADDVWFDATNKHVYVSGGEGFISIHALKDDHWNQIEKFPTRKGARTSFFDPQNTSLFVAAPKSESQQAAILHYTATSPKP